MKKIVALIMTIALAIPFTIPVSAKEPTMKGTWLSFVDIQQHLKGKNQKDFDKSFRQICEQIADNGSNTIFVHVRSHNDAIYPSKVYPWSVQMLGGMDPGFDPLLDMVDIAHEEGLFIHAWINPYGFRRGVIEEHPELATLDNILAGIKEILETYDVDGIHFDDYFPPIGKDALNDMVRKVHALCKKHRTIFGISPQGNISNNIRNGADIPTWLSSKVYVDYIAPQVYWTDYYGSNGTTTKSTDVLNEWCKYNTAKIPMYVGMGLYRAGNPISGDPGWTLSNSNLARQWVIAKEMGYKGYILYDTQSQMTPNAGQQAEIESLKAVAK